MTLPDLALFYGRAVRAKNVLNVLMQCVLRHLGVEACCGSLVGYSLAFGTGNALVGDFSKLGLSGVTIDSVTAELRVAPRNIPEYVFVMFQAMFAIITPALILGAIAGRMKFGIWVAFITIWLLTVYCPIAHMVWSSEGLDLQGRAPSTSPAGSSSTCRAASRRSWRRSCSASAAASAKNR
jgi:Amt family ammonium transporter